MDNKNTHGKSPPTVISAGGLTVDILRRQLSFGGKAQKLTPAETGILYTLLEGNGKAVSREALCEGSQTDIVSLKSNISHLRKKLEGSGYTINSIYGDGYQFDKLQDEKLP